MRPMSARRFGPASVLDDQELNYDLSIWKEESQIVAGDGVGQKTLWACFRLLQLLPPLVPAQTNAMTACDWGCCKCAVQLPPMV